MAFIPYSSFNCVIVLEKPNRLNWHLNIVFLICHWRSFIVKANIPKFRFFMTYILQKKIKT